MTSMTFPLRRAAAAAGVFVLLLSAVTPAALSVTEEEVEQARQEREAAAQERAAAIENLDQAVAEFEAVTAELEQLTFKVGQLRSRVDAYQDSTRDLRVVIRERAVQSYMNGEERDPVARVFAPETVQQSIIARQVLALAVESDSAQLDDLAAATAEMQRLQDELDSDSLRLAALRADADAIVARMNELYEEADLVYEKEDAEFQQVEAALEEQIRQEEERRRREEEARKQRERMQAALQLPAEGVPDWVTPGFICPVGGPTWFNDTWGAPRSGGRTHKGVDMMGPRYTPLVAVGDGVVRLSYGSLGGNIVWLYADHGVNYFYAHLDSYPDGLTDGQRVVRGQVIGYMGDTGNPAPGAYHVHFGIYPGGIKAVNPYPTVARACN